MLQQTASCQRRLVGSCPAAVSADFTALFSSLSPMMLRGRQDRLFSQELPFGSTNTAAAWSGDRSPAGPQLLAPHREREERCVHQADDELAMLRGGQGRETHGYVVLSAFSRFQLQACSGYTYLH